MSSGLCAFSPASNPADVFSSLNDTNMLDLGLRMGDPLSALTSALPANAKATAFKGLLSQQAHRGLFQATYSGTGITAANNVSFGCDLLIWPHFWR